MSAAQLERMRRVPNPRQIRQQLGNITQERFARLFQIPVGTLRDWEQGVHNPDSPAKALLRTIEADPVAVTRALNPTMSIQEIRQQLGQDLGTVVLP
jgi:putative transcriptional regulator